MFSPRIKYLSFLRACIGAFVVRFAGMANISGFWPFKRIDDGSVNRPEILLEAQVPRIDRGDCDTDWKSLASSNDFDSDGKSDFAELSAGTYPAVRDTDGDDILDGSDPDPLNPLVPRKPPPNPPQDQTLVQAERSREIYWIQNGEKYHVANSEVRKAMSGIHGWDKIIQFPDAGIDFLPSQGEFIFPCLSLASLLLPIANFILIKPHGSDVVYLTLRGCAIQFPLVGPNNPDVIEVSSQIFEMVDPNAALMKIQEALKSISTAIVDFTRKIKWTLPSNAKTGFLIDIYRFVLAAQNDRQTSRSGADSTVDGLKLIATVPASPPRYTDTEDLPKGHIYCYLVNPAMHLNDQVSEHLIEPDPDFSKKSCVVLPDAGPGQTVTVGSTEQLDGQPNNPSIKYKWKLVSKPEGSDARLSSTTISNPTFVADKEGTYALRLIVKLGHQKKVSSNVTIKAIVNQPPIINSITADPATVDLDNGNTSIISVSASDPENDPLTYTWSATGGTLADTSDPSKKIWTAPSAIGTYTVSVSVTDNKHPAIKGSKDISVVDTAAPQRIQNFQASDGDDTRSVLTWTNPPDPDLAKVMVRYRTDMFPANHFDGGLVLDDPNPIPNDSEVRVDRGLSNNQAYYYAVFSRDQAGNWNDSTAHGENKNTGNPRGVGLYDDFNDSFLDLFKWQSGGTATGTSFNETDNQMEFTIAPTASNGVAAGTEFAATVQSTCKFVREFEIEVDYQLLQWSAQSGTRIGLGFTNTDGSWKGSVERVSFAPSEFPDLPNKDMYVVSTQRAGQSIDTQGLKATSDTAGKLKMVKLATTLEGDYWDANTNSWVRIGTSPTVSDDVTFQADATFRLAMWSAGGVFSAQSNIEAAFDNIIIRSGQSNGCVPFPESAAFITIPAQGAVLSTFVVNAGDSPTVVQLTVFDLLGRLVRNVDRVRSGLAWRGEDNNGQLLPNGVYLAVITTRREDGTIIKSEVKKLVILR